MSFHAPAEIVERHDCSVVYRVVAGPRAQEVFLHAQPRAAAGSVEDQADRLHRAIREVAAEQGGSGGEVVAETVFARTIAEAEAIRALRGGAGASATNLIEQPPVDGAPFAVSLRAIAPHEAETTFERLATASACPCAECVDAHAILETTAQGARVRAGALHGAGEGAYAQTVAMFELAEALLDRAGLGFRDVVRTWIHLRDIDRDYDALNRGRRDFFASRKIDPPPASTGIGGGPPADVHDLCLAFEAIEGAAPVVMHTPTLNEAPEYGADFTRGMRIEEENGVTLHVSGTASIDEAGRTAHVGDFAAQAERMLRNIAGLLEGQAAGFGDVVSAITYLRDPADADALRAQLSGAGFEGFPHAIVHAPICRPDLLCETEALAILPPG